MSGLVWVAVEGALALSCILCLVILALRPLKSAPSLSLRYVGLVGLAPLAVTAALLAASQYDLRYAAAGLLTYYTAAVAETTGALALAVMIYSEANRNSNISPQWYALPTGSSPLALLSNYFPTSYIQLGIFSVLGLYLLSEARQLPNQADSLRLSAFSFLGAALIRVLLERFDYLLDLINSNVLGVVGMSLTPYQASEIASLAAVCFLLLHLRGAYGGKIKSK